MRTLMGVAAVAALMAAAPKAGQAQDYPWCAIQYDGDGGEITTCGYVSRQQCMDFIWGVGGYCRMNPYLVAPQPQPAPPAAKKKRHT